MSNLQGNNNVKLHKFEKVNYFYGQLMTVLDFETQRNNFDEKRYLVNRLVHGFGLVYGLSNDDISIPDDNGEDVKIKFEKGGMALDCCGHEIVILPETVNIVTEQGTHLKKSDVKTYTYLFLRYKECFGGQKVFAASNPSSCQDICYHNRLKEDFEVVASNTPPGALCGTADGGDNNSIILADSTLGGNLIGMRITIIKGEGNGQSRKITGYDESNNKFTIEPDWTTKPNHTSGYRIEFCSDFPNNKSEEEVRKKIEKWVEIIASYPFCDTDDPKVFLAAMDESLKIDEDETRKYVSLIYNNKLISELLMCHLSHFDNPHRTTAEHVKALKSINNVGNGENKQYVSNIDLESQNATITITGDQVSNNKINLETVPATTVKSVEETGIVGEQTSFAREDHVHNLAENVVKRNNFNDDVIPDLLGSDNKTITISVDKKDNKKINIITSPATTVTSVMETKKQGVKTSFAREDHIHDLDRNVVKRDNFNEDVIQNLLVSDETIKIEKDVQNKVIKISTASGAVLASKTGLWLWNSEEDPISHPINPGLGKGPICIILGLEEGENEPILIGSHEVFDKPQVLLGARVDPQSGTFEIGIKADGPKRVRWWAFKAVIEELALKTVKYKVFEKMKLRVENGLSDGEEYGMVGEKVALNGNPNKLVDLLFNQRNETYYDEYLSNIYEGETWILNGGWTLYVKKIDVENSEATIIIRCENDESEITVKGFEKGKHYTYIERNIDGESDVPMLVTYFDALFYTEYPKNSGEYAVKYIRLKYTWVISKDVKHA